MISTPAPKLVLMQGARWQTHVRVLIEDPDGVMQDFRARMGVDWFESAEWGKTVDDRIATGTVELRREAAGLSLSPMMDGSPLNRTSGGVIAPAVDMNRRLEIWEQVTAPGAAAVEADWVRTFDGRVQDVDWAASVVRLPIADRAIELVQRIIRVKRTYGSEAGVPVEDVMQALLDDEFGAGAWTLLVPTSPGFSVTKYERVDVSVWSALEDLSKQFAGYVEYRAAGLTLVVPDRGTPTPVVTFGPDQYKSVPQAKVSLADIRTVIGVKYRNKDTGLVASVEARAPQPTIDAYGDQYLGITESDTSVIDSSAEAQAMANAIRDDLALPRLVHQIVGWHFYPVELGDGIQWLANGVHYDTDQVAAVTGFRHRLSRDQRETVFDGRPAASGGYKRWLKLGKNQPPTDIDTFRVEVVAFESADGSTGTLQVAGSQPTRVDHVEFTATLADGTTLPGLAPDRNPAVGAYERDIALDAEHNVMLAAEVFLTDGTSRKVAPVTFDRDQSANILGRPTVSYEDDQAEIAVRADSDTLSLWRQESTDGGVSWGTEAKIADGREGSFGLTASTTGKRRFRLYGKNALGVAGPKVEVYVDKYVAPGTGTQGAPALHGELTNEFQGLPADAAGVVLSYANAVTTMLVFIGQTDDTADWTFAASPSAGVAGTLAGNVYTVTSLTAETGYVDLVASRAGYPTLTARFNLAKVRGGADGADGVSYALLMSSAVLKRSQAGAYTPSALTATAKRTVGTTAPANYAGRFRVYESGDGETFSLVYNSPANESSHAHTPTPGIAAVKVELYLAGGFTVLLDYETVSVVEDGQDGGDGPPGASDPSCSINQPYPDPNTKLPSTVQVTYNGTLGTGGTGPLQWRRTWRGITTAWSTTALPQFETLTRHPVHAQEVVLEVKDADGLAARATAVIAARVTVLDPGDGGIDRTVPWHGTSRTPLSTDSDALAGRSADTDLDGFDASGHLDRPGKRVLKIRDTDTGVDYAGSTVADGTRRARTGLNTSGRVVTGVEASADIAGRDAYRVSRQEAVFRETFEVADSVNHWIRRTGAGTQQLTWETGGIAGGHVMRVRAYQWLVAQTLIPFNPNALYLVFVRAQFAVSNLVQGLCYFGVEGVAADGSTLVNVDGVDTFSSQYYAAGGALAVSGLRVWHEYKGYIRGQAASGNGGSSSDPTAPITVHSDVRYLRPLVICGYQNGDSWHDIDEFSIYELENGTVRRVYGTVDEGFSLLPGVGQRFVGGAVRPLTKFVGAGLALDGQAIDFPAGLDAPPVLVPMGGGLTYHDDAAWAGSDQTLVVEALNATISGCVLRAKIRALGSTTLVTRTPSSGVATRGASAAYDDRYYWHFTGSVLKAQGASPSIVTVYVETSADGVAWTTRGSRTYVNESLGVALPFDDTVVALVSGTTSGTQYRIRIATSGGGGNATFADLTFYTSTLREAGATPNGASQISYLLLSE